MAVSSLRFFDRLSDLLLKVGKSSSVTKDLVHLFPNSKELQDLMCEYLITLVSFCGKVVKALQKPSIIQLANPFVAFFEKEASQFQTDLGHWATAIERRANVILSKEQLESRDAVKKISRSLNKWFPSGTDKQHSLILRSRRLQDSLYPWQAERVAAWRRQRRKGSVRWFFWSESYINWRSKPGPNMLWVHGKLGSGKTVLLANLVAELYCLPQDGDLFPAFPASGGRNAIVAYVFCSHDRPDSNTYELIIGSIIQQILAQVDPDSDLAVMIDAHIQRNPPDTLHDYGVDFLRRLLPTNRVVYVIIDALDECTDEVAHSVLVAIRSISDAHFLFYSCCSTRSGAPISTAISDVFRKEEIYSVTMSSPVAQDEMRAFINAEFERRRHVRQLDPSLEETLKEFLIQASQGM